jgi:hypothetical protein
VPIRSRKLPLGSGAGPHPTTTQLPSDERSRAVLDAKEGRERPPSSANVDWQKIASEYGEKLSVDVRNAIIEATQEFLSWEVYERTAEKESDAEAVIHACKKGAKDFRQVLLDRAFKSSSATVCAKHLIKKHFDDPRLGNKSDLFHGHCQSKLA